MAEIMQATQAFSFHHNGIPLVISPGDLYYADDVVVKGRESLFRAVEVKATQARTTPTAPTAAASETASAAPSQRRRVTTPAKSDGEV